MKLSGKLKFVLASLYHLFRYVFVTGLDNRLLAPLFGIRLCNLKKPAAIKEPRLRFSGAVRDYGHFVQCSDVVMDFGLCGLRREKGGRKPRQCWYFEDGFMQIGGRVSPPGARNLPFSNLDEWALAQVKVPPVADVVHQEPVLLVSDYHKWNPAVIMRQIYSFLYNLEVIDVRSDDATLLFFHADPEEPLDELTAKLFNVQHVKDMRGVHLFRNVLHCYPSLQQGWQHRRSVDLMRRHLLPAFGITPRRGSSDINRITLISRHDYAVEWGVNRLTRKISNEDEIVAVLRRHFPAAEVHSVQLEQLSVAEQLRLIHQADILISMHGAALGFAALLPENTGLLELFPAHFLCAHWYLVFYLLAVGGGVHYRRWINFNPAREHCSEEWAERQSAWGLTSEPKRDFTEVPPRAVLRQVKALQRAMRRGCAGRLAQR